jgi:hypothetical protein
VHLLGVELELRTLEHVAVAAAALARAGRHTDVHAANGELLLESRVEHTVRGALGVLGLHGVGDLGVIGDFKTLGLPLRGTRGDTVVLLIPLAERGGINLDDCALDKSLGADKLCKEAGMAVGRWNRGEVHWGRYDVADAMQAGPTRTVVGGVVGNVQDTGLPRDGYKETGALAPVTRIHKTQIPVVKKIGHGMHQKHRCIVAQHRQ